MTEKTTYRTTTKGRAEAAAKPGTLKPGIKGLLAAVGESTSAEYLRSRFPHAGDISAALEALTSEGYIKMLPAAAAAPAAVAELESFLGERPKEPTLQQRREAEATISGARRLKAGYQISILNRPGKPIVPRGGGGSKHVILLIDSHEAEALAAARSLLQAGFDIRGAANRGEIAAALAKPPLPDLIIIDVEMHDAVGLDVLGKLHEHAEFRSTPIIVVTARAERDDIVAALAYGASGYLNNPVKPDTLVRHTRDALGLP